MEHSSRLGSSLQKVILKKGREKSIYFRHPWLFSGAIHHLPQFNDGDILQVFSSEGKFLGRGYFNRKSQIIGRMLTFDDTPIEIAVQEHIRCAFELRTSMSDLIQSNSMRLINAESDNLPGLIVDSYDKVLVLQSGTKGIDNLKSLIVDALVKEFKPSWIFEHSTSNARKHEGLLPQIGTLYGEELDEVEINEGGLKFFVRPKHGQKTGFFHDLRQMRFLIQKLAKGKRVLNCCSYTGAFTVHALKGGAQFCTSCDISKEAILGAQRNISANGFSESVHEEVVEDVFSFLQKNDVNYDIVILDPPAFAKKKHDIKRALSGYKELNRCAIKKMPQNSFLLTCSCSYHIDDGLFQKMLFEASCDAGRKVQILHRHRLAYDHPISIYHPESEYLKSILCRIL